MASSPLTPPEEEARRLREQRWLQEQVEDLTRRLEELAKQSARYVHGAAGVLTPSALLDQRSEVPPLPSVAISPPTTSVVPGWLAPLLQGITILIVIGAVFWVGQTTGTINTKVDNLQNSVDRLNNWQDTASVSLGSVDTKVTLLHAKIDDLSRNKR